MSLPLSFNVQAKFKFYRDEESMVKDWKQAAKYNASQATFLEGMLLKNVDPGGELLTSVIYLCVYTRLIIIVNQRQQTDY